MFCGLQSSGLAPLLPHHQQVSAKQACVSVIFCFLKYALIVAVNFCTPIVLFTNSQQAIQLLEKFLRYDIIERVNLKQGEGAQFKDNKDLYRLKKENIPILQLEDINKSEDSQKNDQCDQTNFKISSFELGNIWKSLVVKNIKEIAPSFHCFINNDDINSFYILHNATRLSKNGVVMLNDKSQDIPHWVMSAMKCLACCKLFTIMYI